MPVYCVERPDASDTHKCPPVISIAEISSEALLDLYRTEPPVRAYAGPHNLNNLLSRQRSLLVFAQLGCFLQLLQLPASIGPGPRTRRN